MQNNMPPHCVPAQTHTHTTTIAASAATHYGCCRLRVRHCQRRAERRMTPAHTPLFNCANTCRSMTSPAITRKAAHALCYTLSTSIRAVVVGVESKVPQTGEEKAKGDLRQS
jgi:hypothetical protein